MIKMYEYHVNSLHLSISAGLLFFLLLSPISNAADHIGYVKTNEPIVSAIRGGNEIRLTSGSEVFKEDTIVTDSDGAVGITFEDGAVLTLGHNAKVVIEDYLFQPAEKNVSFITRVIIGSVSFMSGAIGRISPESVKIKTPTATLGMRGTKILVEVD